MKRLPVGAFAALVVATIGAFFVTQHLKSSTPLYAGFPKPHPQWINPLRGGACDGVGHRATTISFYLLHRADDVDVYVVDGSGEIIRTIASGRRMRIRVRNPDGIFHWDGRTDSGAVAPDGVYYFRVALRQQGRTVQLGPPVMVRTVAPRPRVRSVSPSLIPQGSEPVTIRYNGNEHRSGTMRIYRTDTPGPPRLVTSFPTDPRVRATWNGLISGRPAPAGTYLIGLDVVDQTCNVGRFPPELPPPPHSTAHAGLTIRYLAAQPPLDPVEAGERALVYVDSRQQPYRWTLTRVGLRKPVSHGGGRAFVLQVRVPKSLGAGLYVLSLRSGAYRTAVPLVARAAVSRARVLIVLPALTWQGENRVDDDDDGIPNTLANGGPVRLGRPLTGGLPAGFPDEAALIAYLDHARLSYDLTTDLGLIHGIGPTLRGHAGTVLAGTERWQAVTLGSALRSYVAAGGRVMSIGVDSLRAGVRVLSGNLVSPSAPAATDGFGVAPGRLVTGNRDLITVIRDGLGIFSSTSGAFPGFTSYQVLRAPRPPASVAGTGDATTSIIGFGSGRGTVVEVGLPGFGAALARNVDARELLGRLWTVLRR